MYQKTWFACRVLCFRAVWERSTVSEGPACLNMMLEIVAEDEGRSPCMLWFFCWVFQVIRELVGQKYRTGVGGGDGGCRSRVMGELVEFLVWIWKALSQDACWAEIRTKTGSCRDILVRAEPPTGLERRQKLHTHNRNIWWHSCRRWSHPRTCKHTSRGRIEGAGGKHQPV